jgi:polysaccharide biosynthesis transport protein
VDKLTRTNMSRPTIEAQKELTLKDLWMLLQQRRSIVVWTTLVIVALAGTFCLLCTRRYEVHGQIQIQKESMDGLGLESMMGAADGASDALDANITIQTQANILQSDTLAIKVISDLNLESNEDFRPSFNPIGWVVSKMSPNGPEDPQHATLENSPKRRMHALKVFNQYLKVKPVSGTRLIEITYDNPDRKVAADVINHLTQGLFDYTFQTRYTATSQASEWLGGQLSDLRKQSEELQAKVVQLQRDSGVFTLGETTGPNGTQSQIYSTVLDKLQQSTAAVTQAQANSVLKGALYQSVKNGDAELISGLSGSPMLSGASSGVSNSLALIQNLRMQEATTQAQLDQSSAKFGPSYPKLDELRSSLSATQNSIHAEVGRVAARAKNDYEVAERVEDSTKASFESQKRQADSLNDKAIEYAIVHQEADESRLLYETLLTKLKEAGVLQGLKASNITVVDPGRIPAKPTKPNILLILAGALFAGPFVGCCGALVVDALDSKIRNIQEFQDRMDVTAMGVLPFYGDKPVLRLAGKRKALPPVTGVCELPVLLESRSPFVEAVRALRSSLMLAKGGSAPKVILVTSSIAAEGKSTLSMNLGVVLAQQGSKVLVVDADLRRPKIHRGLNLDNASGLSSLLTGQAIDQDAVRPFTAIKEVPNLYVLTAGPVPPYPSELLGSDQMKDAVLKWRREFDFVLLDGSPVLPVTDSVLLSSLVDLTLLVVRYDFTERQSVQRSYQLIYSQGGQTKIGMVLNAVDRNASSYYEYYGYRDSHYYGSEA